MSEEKQGAPVQTALVQTVQTVPAAWNNTVSDEVEIDLGEILYLLWGNIVKILICMVAGALLAFGYTFFLVTPKYTATARMYILSSSSNSVVNLSDLQISNNLRADYQELLTSRPLIEDVIKDLSLTYNYNGLVKMIKITNPSDTRILNVTVTTPSGQMSADIANDLVKQARLYLPRIMKTDEPSIFEDAIVPTGKSSPSYSRNTIIGALLGGLACCAFLIIRHISNDTMVTPDDVYKALGIEPLATIPEGNLGSFNREAEKRKKSRRKKRDSKSSNEKEDKA
ncbi:MAG: hypothetical protein IKD66_08020 [Solobacterium sp.]|nr:hypothetical protein [Solobacterium sp.]